ncbi:MAG: hypothetical protein ABIO24_07730, partial [Saprospiraceae bacterium]
MLALFRNNQLSTFALLALYTALLHASALLGYGHPVPGTGAEGGVLYRDWFSWVEGREQISAIAAVVLVLLQALLVNNLADQFRLLGDRNWLPGLFYVLAASCLPDFLF